MRAVAVAWITLGLILLSGCSQPSAERPAAPTARPDDRASESPAAAPAADPTVSQSVRANWAVDNPACAGDATQYDAVPMSEGLNHATFEVDPGTIGRYFVARFAANAAYDHLAFFDAEGALLAQFDVGVTEFSWNMTGKVPDGAHLGVFYMCGGLGVGEAVDYLVGARARGSDDTTGATLPQPRIAAPR